MDAYYDEQIFSPQYFGGPSRQLGSGGLAFRVARVTLPLVKKYIWPVAKRLGRELITQAVPEVIRSTGNQRRWIARTVKHGKKNTSS